MEHLLVNPYESQMRALCLHWHRKLYGYFTKIHHCMSFSAVYCGKTFHQTTIQNVFLTQPTKVLLWLLFQPVARHGSNSRWWCFPSVGMNATLILGRAENSGHKMQCKSISRVACCPKMSAACFARSLGRHVDMETADAGCIAAEASCTSLYIWHGFFSNMEDTVLELCEELALTVCN